MYRRDQLECLSGLEKLYLQFSSIIIQLRQDIYVRRTQIHLCIYLSNYLSTYISIISEVFFYNLVEIVETRYILIQIHLSIYLSNFLSIYLSNFLSIYISIISAVFFYNLVEIVETRYILIQIHLCIYLSIYISISLSLNPFYLFIYLEETSQKVYQVLTNYICSFIL